MWAAEHLVDIELTREQNGGAYTRRAKYAYLLDQHLSAEEFIDLADEYTNVDVPRVAYCIWKDGETTQWSQQGQDIHPKI